VLAGHYEHVIHLHRHSFEVTKIGDKPTSGVMKDTISMSRYFFHCHHQHHMDEGFSGLITYA
jgi:FtsP/CotA-like multicopper oxidase with cupredoxin domain